jgi:GTPase SAR1 family protein
MTEKIFVSYAHQDRDLVQAVVQNLREHGIVTEQDVVILDHQDFIPGQDVRRMIKDQISSASKVVIIASDDSANSEWVNYEAGMAAALEKPIFVMGRKGTGKSSALIRALDNVESIEI